MDTDSLDRQTSRGLVLPWGWLSLGLTVVAISALGTLAVIAKREGADTLSTIALALAVLSFAAQLIVSLAQAFNGTQQVAQADRVNADTRASLAAIRATSDALLVNQREQFSEVLRAALKIAVPAAVQDVEEAGAGGENDDSRVQVTEDSIRSLEERLSVRINEALRNIRTQADDPSINAPRPISPTLIRMTTYPTIRRGLELLELLNNLSPQESALFTKWATRTLRTVQQSSSSRPIIPNFVIRGPIDHDLNKLVELGLLTLQDHFRKGEESERRLLRLTDLGIEVASLILGEGDKPAWLEAAGRK